MSEVISKQDVSSEKERTVFEWCHHQDNDTILLRLSKSKYQMTCATKFMEFERRCTTTEETSNHKLCADRELLYYKPFIVSSICHRLKHLRISSLQDDFCLRLLCRILGMSDIFLEPLSIKSIRSIGILAFNTSNL